MTVYIGYLQDIIGAPKIVKHLGVFTTRSRGLRHVQELVRTAQLPGGRFPYSIEDLQYRENEPGFNPAKLLIYETGFYQVIVEASLLI